MEQNADRRRRPPSASTPHSLVGPKSSSPAAAATSVKGEISAATSSPGRTGDFEAIVTYPKKIRVLRDGKLGGQEEIQGKKNGGFTVRGIVGESEINPGARA